MTARKAFSCFGIGEILWDLLPSGRQLGGAPANFAYHAHALGIASGAISRIGNDSLGHEIQARFNAMSLPVSHLQVDDVAPTGTVEVQLTSEGQPRFIIHENVAWDRLAASGAALAAISQADAICFGTLAQRHEVSRKAILSLVAATPPQALRIFDINLRQHFYSREIIEQSLTMANVLKLNHDELPVLAAMFNLSGSTKAQMQELALRFELRLVALTRGADGSLLFSEGHWSEQAGIPAKVIDTVGAGDCFTAALAVGLLNGIPLDGINFLANQLASYVCSCPGATPPLPAHFRAAVHGHTKAPSVAQVPLDPLGTQLATAS